MPNEAVGEPQRPIRCSAQNFRCVVSCSSFSRPPLGAAASPGSQRQNGTGECPYSRFACEWTVLVVTLLSFVAADGKKRNVRFDKQQSGKDMDRFLAPTYIPYLPSLYHYLKGCENPALAARVNQCLLQGVPEGLGPGLG